MTVLPLTVHMLWVELLNVTGKPDEAVALTVTGLLVVNAEDEKLMLPMVCAVGTSLSANPVATIEITLAVAGEVLLFRIKTSYCAPATGLAMNTCLKLFRLSSNQVVDVVASAVRFAIDGTFHGRASIAPPAVALTMMSKSNTSLGAIGSIPSLLTCSLPSSSVQAILTTRGTSPLAKKERLISLAESLAGLTVISSITAPREAFCG